MTCSICRKKNCTKRTHCIPCSKEKQYPVHHRTGLECKIHLEISLAKTHEEQIEILRKYKVKAPKLPPRGGDSTQSINRGIEIIKPRLPPRSITSSYTRYKSKFGTIADKKKDKKKSDSIKCVICLDTLDGPMRILKNCNHSFHNKCFEEGLCDFCPLCRIPIPESERKLGTQLSMQLKIQEAIDAGLPRRAEALILQDLDEQEKIKKAASQKRALEDTYSYSSEDEEEDYEEDDEEEFSDINFYNPTAITSHNSSSGATDTSTYFEEDIDYIDITGGIETQKYEEDLWKCKAKSIVDDCINLIKELDIIIKDSFEKNKYTQSREKRKEYKLTQAGVFKTIEILKNNVALLQKKVNYSVQNKIPMGLMLS